MFCFACGDSDALGDGPPLGMSLEKEHSTRLLVVLRGAGSATEQRQVFRVNPFQVGGGGVGFRFTDESLDLLEWADDADGARISLCDPDTEYVYWHGTLDGDLQSHNWIFVEDGFDSPEQLERLKARLAAGSRHAESQPR